VSQSEEEIEIASVPMRLVGTGGNKMQSLKDLLTTFKANQSDQRLANETASQVMLITFPFTYSPIADQMDDLKGSTFIATSTLQAGLQSGEPTTHAEVVRWFGTSVLLALGNALFVTSDENDWGYGVKLPAWPGFKFGHWVCESTLRTSAIYTSFGVIQLSILLAFCVLIILISYALVPVLGVIVSKKSKSKHGLGGTTSHIRNQLLRHQLHNMLQLHRIAVEKTYLVEFTGTGDTIPRPVGIHPAPIYGMRRRDTSGTEWEELQGLDQGGNRDDGNGEGDVGLNKNYATMLK
jgi:hypothetical protein